MPTFVDSCESFGFHTKWKRDPFVDIISRMAIKELNPPLQPPCHGIEKKFWFILIDGMERERTNK